MVRTKYGQTLEPYQGKSVVRLRESLGLVPGGPGTRHVPDGPGTRRVPGGPGARHVPGGPGTRHVPGAAQQYKNVCFAKYGQVWVSLVCLESWFECTFGHVWVS